MTAKEIFEEFLSGEPLTEEAVIDALNEALDEGYCEGYNDACRGGLDIDFIADQSINDPYSLN